VASVLRFVLFAGLMVGLLLFVVVPIAAGPIVGGMVRQAGFPGQDVDVSVDLFGPALFSGRAQTVHLQADDVAVPHGNVGRLDLTLSGVSVSDHSFQSVSGTLHDVMVNGPDGVSISVRTVDLHGPATRAMARGKIDTADAERMVRDVAAGAGVDIDSVELRDGGLRIKSGGNTSDARLRVAGRALILDQDGKSTVLVAPATSEDWHLDGVSIGPDGIQVDLEVDAQALANQLTDLASPAPAEPHASPPPSR
jgi:hypothetical protein